jgi:rubrerythrin
MNSLDYAIKMEQDGEKYYREQAQIYKDNALHTVCNLLADEENAHAKLLESKKNKSVYQLTESDFSTRAKNVFADLKDIEVEGTKAPSQLDFYRVASDMEKQSIDLYQKFLSEATDEEDKKLFEYLIGQEKNHLEAFEELSRLLYNAEWWIDSPEFGRRNEEY